MNPTEPLVSVNMVTYNHEKYIAAAIQSVLEQTFTDFELVIVDDGSTDNTPHVIASFKDPRIVSVRQTNQGPSMAANRALQECRGKYVALMSGDDVCRPDRIDRQLDEYQGGPPRLLFSPVEFIDERGKPMRGRHFADGLFDAAPRSRADILRHFFRTGNFINAITCFTEREVLRGIGPFDPVLYQLQDFELWVRLVKRYDFQFMTVPTVRYRIRGDGLNLSAPHPHNQVRIVNEHHLIMRRFFDDMPVELLREAFGDRMRRPGSAAPTELACEHAFLLLDSEAPLNRLLAVDRLRELLADPDTATVLERSYGFNVVSYAELLREVDVLDQLVPHHTTLYVDTGSGHGEKDIRRQTVDFSARSFDIRFDLNGFPTVNELRWDPAELRFCRIRLDRVLIEDRQGKETEVNPEAIVCNGIRRTNGFYDFETLDPVFLFRVRGEFSGVTVQGEWEVEARERSLSGVGPRLLEKTQQFYAQQAELNHQAELQRQEHAAQVARLSEEVRLRREEIAQRDEVVRQRDEAVRQRDEVIGQRDEIIGQRDAAIAQREGTLAQREVALAQREEVLAQRDESIRRLNDEARQRDEVVRQRDSSILRLIEQLRECEDKLVYQNQTLALREQHIDRLLRQMNDRDREIAELTDRARTLDRTTAELTGRLQECEEELQTCQAELEDRDGRLQQLFASRSWRIMSRLRSVWNLARLRKGA